MIHASCSRAERVTRHEDDWGRVRCTNVSFFLFTTVNLHIGTRRRRQIYIFTLLALAHLYITIYSLFTFEEIQHSAGRLWLSAKLITSLSCLRKEFKTNLATSPIQLYLKTTKSEFLVEVR